MSRMPDDYGTFNELKSVSVNVRMGMFDYIMGKKTRHEFLRLYYAYEVFLLEREYVESRDPYFDMDLPDAEKFIYDPLHNNNINWKKIK